MRYALRNKKKIEAAYPGMIGAITKSLDAHFKDMHEISLQDSGEEFPLLMISGSEHSLREVNLIAFYVLGIKFDVYRLAFNEFIE